MAKKKIPSGTPKLIKQSKIISTYNFEGKLIDLHKYLETLMDLYSMDAQLSIEQEYEPYSYEHDDKVIVIRLDYIVIEE